MKSQLVSKKFIFENAESFIFEPETPINRQAGQYLHYVLSHHEPDDRGEERWFTISATPFEKHIMMTTRFTVPGGSSFKKALRAMKIGDFIEGDTPEGDFIIDTKAKKHILIAGGIGITPYRAMLLQLDHGGQDINADLLYANRDENFVFDDELAKLAQKHPNFNIYKFIGDKRIEKSDLIKCVDDKATIFYLSGPKAMVGAYEQILADLGVKLDRIKTDFFPGYGTYGLDN